MTEQEILQEIHQFLTEWKERKILKKIDSFRKERVELIEENKGPVDLEEGTKVLLHLIPKDSFERKEEYDLSIFLKQHKELPTLRNLAYTQTYNYDGLLHFNPLQNNKSREYVQLFHNGILEALSIYSTRPLDADSEELLILEIEQDLIEKARVYIDFLGTKLGVNFPVFLHLSLLEVSKCIFQISKADIDYIGDWLRPIGQPRLDLPAKSIERPDIDLSEFFSGTFDRIWNAVGYPKSVLP